LAGFDRAAAGAAVPDADGVAAAGGVLTVGDEAAADEGAGDEGCAVGLDGLCGAPVDAP
jgi:hypothetical protein